MTAPATLRMTAEDFAGLAGCRPSPTALRVLRDGQISRRLLMLMDVAAAARSRAPEFWESRGAAAWELCSRARRADVRAFEAVLLHPHVGVWLGRCMRALDGPRPAARAGTHLARLGGLAAAAALRAGLRPQLALPAPDSLLWLPTLGVVRLPGDAVEARLRGDVLEPGGRLPAPGQWDGSPRWGESQQWDESAAHGTAWCAPRRLVVHGPQGTPPLSVVLEDFDPYRDAHGHRVLPGRTAGDLRAWQASVASAWDVLTRLLPDRAEACASLWSSLVPLRPPETGEGVSSSAREAYGAIAASFTSDPVQLAETVVHESAHIAFGALADLTDLWDPEDATLLPVGWREDLRPIGSALTGTHAHLALLEFWRRRGQEVSGGQACAARDRLRHYGVQVVKALRLLQAHRPLPPMGRHFVSIMVAEAARCGFSLPPPPSARPLRASHHRVALRETLDLGRRRAASTSAQEVAAFAVRSPGCRATTVDETTPGAG
ncbi:aKG-HExxH-type peptide beta-hydroxylase [Streptomyces griseorubiginosus]|uniref:aKG-HExxH-type peptide beta-hydroxylase n=1 Tax=Streptomyces griseorubiginosus TaxID=67304 RepID=UPI002E80EF33|nr:HEXXH motif-containing putative peptide modification protein [Streptomyces griseorubiginosus]WUB45866.1 HEXXH motif-containing putative peptide modification protein [Streptomyces griseorubiginosus]WUB54386.1 HEXXH motif-containing putative peptide modification protein [Streptomyces griseorubiginosus]